MLYTKVSLDFTFEQDYQEDLLFQGLGDLGFESFEGHDAYIPTDLFSREALVQFLTAFGKEQGTTIVATIEDVPDENWNATWEAEHPMMRLPEGVDIIPHCAFGDGQHETTSMLIEAILQERDARREALLEQSHGEAVLTLPFEGMRVLDNGCGTGVLGIYFAKYGARVVAVDIDEKSVENTLENADFNGVTIQALQGNQLEGYGPFDYIASNIHRNILIEQMPYYAAQLKPQGVLLLSGFLAEDVEAICAAAEAQGFGQCQVLQKGDWRAIKLVKASI